MDMSEIEYQVKRVVYELQSDEEKLNGTIYDKYPVTYKLFQNQQQKEMTLVRFEVSHVKGKPEFSEVSGGFIPGYDVKKWSIMYPQENIESRTVNQIMDIFRREKVLDEL